MKASKMSKHAGNRRKVKGAGSHNVTSAVSSQKVGVSGIPCADYDAMIRTIDRCGYRSISHFVAVAIRNQIAADKG